MTGYRLLLIGLLVIAGCLGARAADDDDSDKSPEAAARFPQPVQVGTLIGRTVLEPLESQPILGHVRRIVKTDDGATKVVVDYGGIFGLGARPIAVPVEAMALLGEYMEILDLKSDQLRALPTFRDTGSVALAKDDIIRVGLARPSH